MYTGRMISPTLKQIPIWLFKTWEQTPQVSEVFDSGSIGIYADRINPEVPRLGTFPEVSQHHMDIFGDGNPVVSTGQTVGELWRIAPDIRNGIILVDFGIQRVEHLVPVQV
jgi:hypothetical protein